MKKFFSIALIVLGVSLLSIPFVSDILLSYYSKSIVEADISNEQLIENYQNLEDEEIEYDFAAIDNINISSIIKGSHTIDERYIIGIIYIPDIDINLPIMEGLTEANLLVGAATMKPHQKFGEGNYTLSGHRVGRLDREGLLFRNLMDIELDTKVYISNGENIFEYNIYDTLVVDETAVDLLADEKSDEKGKPIISLMSCYYPDQPEKRFFALGELVDEYPVE